MRSKLLVLMLLFCAAATAQSSHGYIFFAPGAVTAHSSGATIHIGGGGEGILGKGIGVAAEIGALGPPREFSAAIGAASLNGSYHFLHGRDRKADPYVTAGYSLFFRDGHANLFNFGAGVNYWIGTHWGLKFEFRDHVMRNDCCQTTYHYWGVRIGVAFRSRG